MKATLPNWSEIVLTPKEYGPSDEQPELKEIWGLEQS